MIADRTRWDIDSSRVPVDGIGGLGLLAMAAVTAAMLPPLGALIVMALIGGVVVGLVLHVAERQHQRRLALVLLSILAVLVIAGVAGYRPIPG